MVGGRRHLYLKFWVKLTPLKRNHRFPIGDVVRKEKRQNCKAFTGLTIRSKMIGGGDPFYLKFWVKLTA